MENFADVINVRPQSDTLLWHCIPETELFQDIPSGVPAVIQSDQRLLLVHLLEAQRENRIRQICGIIKCVFTIIVPIKAGEMVNTRLMPTVAISKVRWKISLQSASRGRGAWLGRL